MSSSHKESALTTDTLTSVLVHPKDRTPLEWCKTSHVTAVGSTTSWWNVKDPGQETEWTPENKTSEKKWLQHRLGRGQRSSTRGQWNAGDRSDARDHPWTETVMITFMLWLRDDDWENSIFWWRQMQLKALENATAGSGSRVKMILPNYFKSSFWGGLRSLETTWK